MPLQLFLNELSVSNEQAARSVSVARLKQFVATVRQARGIDAGLILNSDVPLNVLSLAEGTIIASIRNEGECVEESLYLKAINNRAPLKLAAADNPEMNLDLSDYRMCAAAPVRAGQVALGLGFAHLLDGLSLSLASHDYWFERSIELDLTTLDAAGEILTASVTARNADSPAAILHHADALKALLAPAIVRGRELWERRAEILPNLVFIPRTQAQLEGILSGDPMLVHTWTKLRGIDKAIEVWKISERRYPMFPFNVRPESRSRRALAEFRDAEGKLHIFSDHCDLAPTEGRIHFIVEANPNPHALIGHVGRKLGIG
jgi:hypothetical protein